MNQSENKYLMIFRYAEMAIVMTLAHVTFNWHQFCKNGFQERKRERENATRNEWRLSESSRNRNINHAVADCDTFCQNHFFLQSGYRKKNTHSLHEIVRYSGIHSYSRWRAQTQKYTHTHTRTYILYKSNEKQIEVHTYMCTRLLMLDDLYTTYNLVIYWYPLHIYVTSGTKMYKPSLKKNEAHFLLRLQSVFFLCKYNHQKSRIHDQHSL